jgi:hypothetical protein
MNSDFLTFLATWGFLIGFVTGCLWNRAFGRKNEVLKSDSNKLSVAVDMGKLVLENERFREALELIAAPKRPDGTYNRCREACKELARAALEEK